MLICLIWPKLKNATYSVVDNNFFLKIPQYEISNIHLREFLVNSIRSHLINRLGLSIRVFEKSICQKLDMLPEM